MAPILPHMAEDIWQTLPFATKEKSIFQVLLLLPCMPTVHVIDRVCCFVAVSNGFIRLCRRLHAGTDACMLMLTVRS